MLRNHSKLSSMNTIIIAPVCFEISIISNLQKDKNVSHNELLELEITAVMESVSFLDT